MLTTKEVMNMLKLLTFTFVACQCQAFSPISSRVCSISSPTASSSLKYFHGDFLPASRKRHIFLSASEETGENDDAVAKRVGIRKRVSSYFRGSEADDGLTFRERLAKMGLATVLSYGWISNTNAMILVSAAWYAFSSKTKMSPLYPGQWKNFLAVYAGFYVISNFLRPLRVTLAVAVGPYFDRLVNWIQRKTKLPKAAAITATVLMVNLGGTLLLMVGGISLASLLAGVPVFPPK